MSEQKDEPQEQQTQTSSPQQEQETVTIDVGQNQQDQSAELGPRSAFDRCKKLITTRPIKYDIFSIVFVLLILGGGIYGYVAKESTASLVSGVVFGILLAFASYFEGARQNPYPLLVILVFLLVMFGYRYSVAWKFMPSGLFTLLTAIMVLRNCYIIHYRRKQTSSWIEWDLNDTFLHHRPNDGNYYPTWLFGPRQHRQASSYRSRMFN